MKSTWFWPLNGEQDEVLFGWSETRGSDYVMQRLKDFKGTFLADGYVAYDCFAKNNPGITLAQCWTHTRRHRAEKVELSQYTQQTDC